MFIPAEEQRYLASVRGRHDARGEYPGAVRGRLPRQRQDAHRGVVVVQHLALRRLAGSVPHTPARGPPPRAPPCPIASRAAGECRGWPAALPIDRRARRSHISTPPPCSPPSRPVCSRPSALAPVPHRLPGTGCSAVAPARTRWPAPALGPRFALVPPVLLIGIPSPCRTPGTYRPPAAWDVSPPP